MPSRTRSSRPDKIEQRFVGLLKELTDDGWSKQDIYEFYINGDWPSIALGQDFNTCVELASVDLCAKYGIVDEED